MHCPFCSADDTKVIDSRLASEGAQVRRRRECIKCNERFNTYEVAELTLPYVIKGDGRRELFDDTKLRSGLEKALEKRPVGIDTIDTILSHIRTKLRAYGERELNSSQIGEWVMDELYLVDDVAYVRFASVYRSFQDIDAFSEEIKKLKSYSHLKKRTST